MTALWTTLARCRFAQILLLAFPLFASPVIESLSARCAKAKTGQGIVRIIHFGDSHLATASGESSFAKHLHHLFGSGGGGFGLPWVFPKPNVRAEASHGWRKSSRTKNPSRLGLSGGQMETSAKGEWASLVGEFSRIRIYGLSAPGGGQLDILVDGQNVGTLNFDGPLDRPAQFKSDCPPTNSLGRLARKLEIRNVRYGRCLVTGISIENETGVVYSPIAFNGARASWMLEVPDSSFRAQLESEAPDLIILSFGTNEANTAPLLAEAYQRSLDRLLTRLRDSAPKSQILLAGPPDGHLKLGVVSNLESVILIQQSLAARHNAMFVDQRRAMGGDGSIDSWAKEGLANRDLLHLTPAGYERLSVAVLSPLFPGLNLSVPGPLAGQSVASRRAQAATPEQNEHWFYWMRAEDGRLTITDNPTQYPGLKIEKRSSSLSGY